MAASDWPLIPAVPVLSAGLMVGWLWLARRAAWGRSGGPDGGVSLRWAVLICIAYPVYWYAIIALRVSRWIPLEDMWAQIALAWGVPSAALAIAIGVGSHSWIAALGPVLGAPASACAFTWFERRTHGPWYMQSEGVAIATSAAVGAAAWHIFAGGGLAWWAWLARRRRLHSRDRCPGCGYALGGLPGPACPECGAPIPAP